MKKITLLFVFLTFTLYAIAQEEKPNCQPVKGDKTMSFNFVGIATSTLSLPADPLTQAQMMDLRYFMKDDLAFRLGLGIRSMSTTNSTTSDSTGPTTPLVVAENKVSQFGFSIAAGLEKHISTKSKTIDPYIGAGIYFSSLGAQTTTATSNTTNDDGTIYNTTSEIIADGGSGFGIQINTGFFWYFAQNIALGGELSLGWATGTTGGDTETNTTTVTSTSSTSTHSVTKNEISLSAIQTLNTGAISLLVKF